MRKECFFCDETECLEQHHILPRRFNGSDKEENLVTVCPTCHRKLEELYDKDFYDKLSRNLSGVVSKKELERHKENTINILQTQVNERSKGFLYGIETALGIKRIPWEKRAESFTPVNLDTLEVAVENV